MGMKDVLSEELKLIRLSKDEVSRFRDVARAFVKKLAEKGLEARIGGSFAKGTVVKKEGVQDVDIFVLFDYSEDILGLEKILKGMDLGVAKLKKVHGSRDYFHVIYPEVILEIVPVVRNKDPARAENVTDMSLGHVKYVVSEIRKNPGLADEICLAKAFCQAQRCYGAEGYVRGFSGYSLEVLVIHFGGFVQFLKGVRKKRVIDPSKFYGNSKEIMREINSSKLQGPLIVVDPTFQYRNVCAGLGLSTFEKFLEVSEKFLKKPSLDFFVRKDLDVSVLEELAQKKGARFLELEFSTDRQEGDIAGTKMRKMMRFFTRELGRARQEVLASEFDYSGTGKKAFGYLVAREKREIERRGPSVGLESQAKKFCDNNEVCFKKGGFWWVREKVSVEGVLKFVQGFSGEMGVGVLLKN